MNMVTSQPSHFGSFFLSLLSVCISSVLFFFFFVSIVVFISIVITNYKPPFTTYFLTRFFFLSHLSHTLSSYLTLCVRWTKSLDSMLAQIIFETCCPINQIDSKEFKCSTMHIINSNLERLVFFPFRSKREREKNDTSQNTLILTENTILLAISKIDNFYYQFLSNVDNLFSF